MSGAVAIDLEAGRAIVGTANCPRAEFYGPYTEAIVSLSLVDGSVQWSFQPHEQGSMQDWDFAGAPNLFEIDGNPVVGLGNKDGFYYVVDRSTGKLVWKAEAQRQAADGDGFAFGGFIGATAVSAGAVVGATAIGDCPCVHAFDAATGKTLWRNNEPSGTYASARRHAGAGIPRRHRPDAAGIPHLRRQDRVGLGPPRRFLVGRCDRGP